MQPSISAASSISDGILEKKPARSQIENAKLKPAFNTINAMYESNNLKKSTSRNMPIIKAVGENIWVASTSSKNAPRSLNLYLAKKYAAGSETNKTNIVAQIATIKLDFKKLAIGACDQTSI